MRNVVKLYIGCLLYTLLLLSSANALAVQPEVEIKVIRGVLSQKSSNDFFHSILLEALSYNTQGVNYKLKPVDFEFSQNRTLRLLNYDNVLDVTHSMTSAEREGKYIAIKVPLLSGLYGKRKLLVMAPNKALFESMSVEQLKEQVACQGRHWPDFTRLEQNGFAVYGVNDYEANYKLLAKGRCTYFPRGIAEIQLDYDKYNGRYGELSIVNSVMLKYEAPIYFFVGKHQGELAKTIEHGLKQMQETGKLKKALSLSKAFHFDPSIESTKDLKVFQLN